ncbi:MAG: histidine--tRNA ligase [Candidatus Hydrogenedens sp.]|nr:histidine--tRNA ligase [Candidatus Hydrogenedens sp.]
MAKKQFVEPRLLKGFQDFLPEDLIPRKKLIAKIERIFEKYGFAPLETPAIEHLDILLGTGGENTNKELFRLQTPEEEDVALRFDLTVPFARTVAQYPDKLKPPFKRYAIGPVWRADKPGPGRFRQFVQFDVDAAGSDIVAVDAEIIAIMSEVMQAAGVPDHTVLINNRKLIDALLEDCGIADLETQKHVLRVIDKLAKVGVDNVRRELGEGRIDDSGDPIRGVGLDAAVIDKMLDFVAISGSSRANVMSALSERLPYSESTTKALNEMTELADALEALGVAEENAKFDPSLARGLDYYTGPVFEMIIPSAPQFGSVMGGGRYNQLVERFMNRPIPCTGMSVGLDRLIAALSHLGQFESTRSPVEALVVTMGNVRRAETLRVASELRAAGINTETYIASKKKMQMGNQLSHADHYGIPVAVILGEEEVDNGTVSIKDLLEGKTAREDIEDRDAYREAGKTGQRSVPRSEMVAAIRQILAAHQR